MSDPSQAALGQAARGFFHGDPGMATFVECPACARTLQAPNDAADQCGRCPSCQTLLAIPPDAPAWQRRRRFRCPYCASTELPIETRRITAAGWTIFAIYLLVFAPLFWIGLLVTEPETRCCDCRRRLNTPCVQP
jgi:hypothetical protein